MLKFLLKPSLVAFLYCLFTVNSLQAVEVSKLDEADVPVTSRAVPERNSALKTALEKVIIKNTGTARSLDNSVIQSQLANPDALLSQFGYVEQNGQLLLKANFEHRRIVSLLRQAQLPVWGTQRPLTLFWVAMPGEGDTILLSDSSTSTERQAFSSFSDERGIPVLLPILDLDELMGINPNDVKGMFADIVASVSGRYQADFLALVAIEPAGNLVRYRLNLYSKTTIDSLTPPLFSFNGSAENSAQAITAMMAALGDYYFTKYAIADSGEQVGASVTFVNIDKMAQVVEVEKYLKQLSAVKNATLSRIQGNTVTFSLDLFGSQTDFERLLSLEPRISVVAPGEFSASASPAGKTVYQWRLP
ncbi:DUF2066 domain-containing protein [Shewanella xiamenensis]|uniref:DUF2066 domain-containing protein n=1 Tax=Shewanella xiamenensis TaxID=332186 RepID=UPI001559E6FE|nr:DUF2066 domain-containing protein [Shewanella xiamenensis]MCL1070760.1 DUF2066 domain-containing protein [Shewanella xiamenensis]GGM92207.1 hypothetical protein GCM10009124_20420 [Shewanella xiamenensis]